MSLKALPTEIDEQILGYLKQTDLSTLSKVSKYHRKIAEPLLYHTIKLRDNRSIKIRSLLLTLLSRNDLAHHIRRLRVRLDSFRFPRGRQLTSEVDNRMEEALPAIQDSIKTIIGTDAGTADVRTTWLGSILSEDFEGGTAALVACLASKIEDISFIYALSTWHSWNFDSCSTFSRMLFEAASASLQHSRYLSKVTVLSFVNTRSIYVPNLPSLQELRVTGSRRIIFPPAQHEDSTLKKVEYLQWTDASTLPSLATFIHQNGLPHLQHLYFSGELVTPANGLQAVIDGLSVGCTELTYLTLASYSERDTPLSRLTTLRSVHALDIDLRFLMLRSDQSQLLNSGGLLPPNLTKLQIRGVFYANIGRLMLEDNPQDPLTLRPFFPQRPSLKEFYFHVSGKGAPNAEYDTLLASIAKMLRARGVVFEVSRYPIDQNNEQGPQLLITHNSPVTQ